MNYSSIDISNKYKLFNDQWQPKVIAEMNDYQFKLVKIKGEFVKHKHSDTDEVFIVLEGKMSIEFKTETIEIKNGEMEDNYYKIVRNESCMLSDIKYECAVLKRFREKENRETLYYLIPDLDYMFLKIIDSGPERNQKLELLEILSLG